MIAQTQEEGERRRALSAPRRMEGGVRRLEIQAGAEGDGRAQGREGEVARPAGLPQALGPEAPPVAAQQELPGGGRSTMVVGPLLRGVAQDVAGAVGNQLQALGTLFPGAQVRSCVPQGGPPGVLSFLYKVFMLNYINAVVRESMTKVVAVRVEGMWAVLCWDLWLSLCRRW